MSQCKQAGQGTYAAISMYMRARLKVFLPYILVEPHIATEGSAFYLKPNMQDTLVIVVAQSGTTVDTNVYVQMAKERGAMSLAIANKREGDVTNSHEYVLFTEIPNYISEECFIT